MCVGVSLDDSRRWEWEKEAKEMIKPRACVCFNSSVYGEVSHKDRSFVRTLNSKSLP